MNTDAFEGSGTVERHEVYFVGDFVGDGDGDAPILEEITLANVFDELFGDWDDWRARNQS